MLLSASGEHKDTKQVDGSSRLFFEGRTFQSIEHQFPTSEQNSSLPTLAPSARVPTSRKERLAFPTVSHQAPLQSQQALYLELCAEEDTADAFGCQPSPNNALE
jgi:hypothetical protein